MSVIFVVIFYVALVAMFVVLHRRNKSVLEYRKGIIDQVSAAASSDINRGRFGQWKWRYKAIESESYAEMAWKFWRPLDSFYPDRSFVDPEAIGPQETVDR